MREMERDIDELGRGWERKERSGERACRGDREGLDC